MIFSKQFDVLFQSAIKSSLSASYIIASTNIPAEWRQQLLDCYDCMHNPFMAMLDRSRLYWKQNIAWADPWVSFNYTLVIFMITKVYSWRDAQHVVAGTRTDKIKFSGLYFLRWGRASLSPLHGKSWNSIAENQRIQFNLGVTTRVCAGNTALNYAWTLVV